MMRLYPKPIMLPLTAVIGLISCSDGDQCNTIEYAKTPFDRPKLADFPINMSGNEEIIRKIMDDFNVNPYNDSKETINYLSNIKIGNKKTYLFESYDFDDIYYIFVINKKGCIEKKYVFSPH